MEKLTPERAADLLKKGHVDFINATRTLTVEELRLLLRAYVMVDEVNRMTYALVGPKELWT